tara:strand:+ start:5743 stop:5919 length:177 start_codon:yes stop_codon:yes gene_type:complete
MNSSFQIIGLFLAFIMIGFFYRDALQKIFDTPKESFFIAISILFLFILFYFFFKYKGF